MDDISVLSFGNNYFYVKVLFEFIHHLLQPKQKLVRMADGCNNGCISLFISMQQRKLQ